MGKFELPKTKLILQEGWCGGTGKMGTMMYMDAINGLGMAVDEWSNDFATESSSSSDETIMPLKEHKVVELELELDRLRARYAGLKMRMKSQEGLAQMNVGVEFCKELKQLEQRVQVLDSSFRCTSDLVLENDMAIQERFEEIRGACKNIVFSRFKHVDPHGFCLKVMEFHGEIPLQDFKTLILDVMDGSMHKTVEIMHQLISHKLIMIEYKAQQAFVVMKM